MPPLKLPMLLEGPRSVHQNATSRAVGCPCNLQNHICLGYCSRDGQVNLVFFYAMCHPLPGSLWAFQFFLPVSFKRNRKSCTCCSIYLVTAVLVFPDSLPRPLVATPDFLSTHFSKLLSAVNHQRRQTVLQSIPPALLFFKVWVSFL